MREIVILLQSSGTVFIRLFFTTETIFLDLSQNLTKNNYLKLNFKKHQILKQPIYLHIYYACIKFKII